MHLKQKVTSGTNELRATNWVGKMESNDSQTKSFVSWQNKTNNMKNHTIN